MSGKTGYIVSTAGAVPVKNERGKVSMEKVKVTRYVAGKRPDYAYKESWTSESSGSDDEEEEERQPPPRRRRSPSYSPPRRQAPQIKDEEALADRRLRRIQETKLKLEEESDDEEVGRPSRRYVPEPELVEEAGPSAEEPRLPRRHRTTAESDDEEEPELSDSEIERQRSMRLAKARMRAAEEEAMAKEEREEDEEAPEASEEEEESSEEDYTDSEDETLPRLKPVFVRKRDRVTLQESEREAERLKALELEAKRAAEDRKRESARLVEHLVKTEEQMEAKSKEDALYDLTAVNTDDEDEELAYEAWKLRELKRIKRNKDEKEALAKEKAEYDRIHNMTEEERRAYHRANPRQVTNKAEKGKYKFLQKYYHRGVFYLDEEDEVYKRNFAEATLEDQFDKSVLPKVMQVKDFGKAGRTKWTHLVAEDTTDFQSPWTSETAQNLKFYTKHAAGVKDVFDRPPLKKKKVIGS